VGHEGKGKQKMNVRKMKLSLEVTGIDRANN